MIGDNIQAMAEGRRETFSASPSPISPSSLPLSAGNSHSDCPLSSWHPPSAGHSCSSPVAPCASGWPFSSIVLSSACTYEDKQGRINTKPRNIIPTAANEHEQIYTGVLWGFLVVGGGVQKNLIKRPGGLSKDADHNRSISAVGVQKKIFLTCLNTI